MASPEVARPELVDQAVQTDFPEPKISKPVVVEMRENEFLEEVRLILALVYLGSITD